MKLACERAAAVAQIPDSATVMIGGFMAVGTPERLADALLEAGRRDLCVIGNDTARPGVGIGIGKPTLALDGRTFLVERPHAAAAE